MIFVHVFICILSSFVAVQLKMFEFKIYENSQPFLFTYSHKIQQSELIQHTHYMVHMNIAQYNKKLNLVHSKGIKHTRINIIKQTTARCYIYRDLKKIIQFNDAAERGKNWKMNGKTPHDDRSVFHHFQITFLVCKTLLLNRKL